MSRTYRPDAARFEHMLVLCATNLQVRATLLKKFREAPRKTAAHILAVDPDLICLTDEEVLQVVDALVAFFERQDRSGSPANMRVAYTYTVVPGVAGYPTLASRVAVLESANVPGVVMVMEGKSRHIMEIPPLHSPAATPPKLQPHSLSSVSAGSPTDAGFGELLERSLALPKPQQR